MPGGVSFLPSNIVRKECTAINVDAACCSVKWTIRLDAKLSDMIGIRLLIQISRKYDLSDENDRNVIPNQDINVFHA